jgi:GH25 family lysozyme M1 (1,4-beta-N-acetylmuramidase)
MRGMVTTVSVAAVVAALLVGAPAAEGSTPVTGPTHPDSDYMGSTIRAHEGTATTRALTSATVPAGNAQGMDVSHWQGTVDWNAAATNGASFAYMKTTEGTTYTDPQFGTDYAGSASAGLARGAYHFALPDSSSGAAQANFFLNNGGGWVSDGHTMPPVLDIEYNPYGTSDWAGWCYGLTTTQMSTWISDFATTIHDRTNRWPVIYTTNGWWSNCTGNDTGSAANDPLWIANIAPDAGTIPGGWTAYTMWQYANTGTFPGDQDVFNGTVDQLRAFATGNAPDLIVAHYNHLGGASSYLGNPSGGEYPIAGGWAQNYDNGVIYYSPATGAWAVHGPILTHYQELGGPGGVLGFPTTDETGSTDGVGRYNHFSGTGGSSIYWTSNTGAHAVLGMIHARWAALGFETGPLGYPTTDETPTPDGVGRYNHFNGSGGSSIYWTPNTGAHGLQGVIRARWAALGWEKSPLGYPTTDETPTPDGVGRYNHFAGTGGSSIYWTPNTGAHAVLGVIHARWGALGWENGPMGYPTTDETPTPDGVGRYNHFSKAASIYWSPSTGAWSVHGAIRDRWASLGWEHSALGYPTSDEFDVADGRRNNFQHGYITWFSATSAIQVTYY